VDAAARRESAPGWASVRECPLTTCLRTIGGCLASYAQGVRSDAGRIDSESSIETLSESLRSSDINLTVDAVKALARIGTDEAVDALIECLEMPQGPRLTMAADSLRKLRSRRAVPALIRCLEARDGELRDGQKRILILALGEMPHASEVPVLAAALKDRSYRMRNAAAWALAQIRAPESTAALEAAGEELSWLRALPIRRGLRVRTRRADQG
jgi:HEAT repeat protein